MSNIFLHSPVLLSEVLEYAAPKADERVLDCTFGRGGYSRAFLEENCHVTALDQDPEAEKTAQDFTSDYPSLFQFHRCNFRDIETIIPPASMDIILFDIGVSSPQIEDGARGFSFNKEGPLDMRMDTEQSITAATLINEAKEEELADIFFTYGEEKQSRKYARFICERRKTQPFETTLDLANFIQRYAKPQNPKRKKIHPATLIFQALRIAVNDELKAFETALQQTTPLLKPNGRLIMVTFHSLEDRIAKQFSKTFSFMPKTSKYTKEVVPLNYFHTLTKKPITASKAELSENPRASSAKLRVLVRTEREEQGVSI